MILRAEQRRRLVELLLLTPPAATFSGRTALLGGAALWLNRDQGNARLDLDCIISQLVQLEDADRLRSLIENAVAYVPGSSVATELDSLRSEIGRAVPLDRDSRSASEVLLRRNEDTKQGGARLGGYELVRVLGRGRFGATYYARSFTSGAEAALKVMLARNARRAAARDAFLREVDVLRTLRHPSIANLLDYGFAGDEVWFAAEYCAGGSLEDVVARRGRLPFREAVGHIIEILDALSCAHRMGLVHRDINPRGLLFAQVEQAPLRLADFGLAKRFESAGLSGLTVTGASAGTPEFIPRDQVLDFKRATPSVDIWSTAACLYFAITGAAPRDLDPTADPLDAVLSAPVVPIRSRVPSLPLAIAQVVDRCLCAEADGRPGSAEEVKDSLLAALG